MYTYGELTAEIIGQGLQLCNELKLRCLLTKERAQNKRALRDFYQQYDYLDMLKDSSNKKTIYK